MGRKKQKPEDSAKRCQILKMADKMFICHGYSAVSMDALAEAVPVSKRTLYNHFHDKRALFTAVMQTRCQNVFTQLEQSLEDGTSPRAALTALAHTFLDLIMTSDSVNIYRTAIMESQAFPELGQLFYECGPKRAAAIFAGYLKKLDEKGLIRVPNPEMAAHFFLGMVKSRLQMQRLLGIKVSLSKKEKDEVVRYAVDIFLRGHQAD